MAAEHKRLTFVVTPELEPVMDKAKKLFYDHTQSDMIRTLIIAGLDSLASDAQDDQPASAPQGPST